MKIVETDNFGRDYPDEKFIKLPPLNKELADKLCEAINKAWSGDYSPRFWKVVEDDYILLPGFEP